MKWFLCHLQEEQSHNRQLMLDMLWVCCTQNNHVTASSGAEAMETDQQKDSPAAAGTISAAMARHLGLLLIELVAPDVIYNGTPWPEEEFMKVTVERLVAYLLSICEYFIIYNYVYVTCRKNEYLFISISYINFAPVGLVVHNILLCIIFRDLQISKLFEDHPVLWDVMDIAALGRFHLIIWTPSNKKYYLNKTGTSQ